MALPSRSFPRPGADRPFPALAGDPAAKAHENPAAVYLAGLAAGPGRDGMRYTLDRIAALAGFPDASAVPWQEFRFQHVAAVRSTVTANLAPATANKYLSALRGVLKAAWRLGQIGTEDYMRAVDVPRAKGSRLPAGRALDHGELRQLFATCAADVTPAGFRDGAAIALLYATGLRRTEAVSLRLADDDRNTGAIIVVGKGNRERTVFACAGARRAVDAWTAVRGPAPGPLLCPVDKDVETSVVLEPALPGTVRDAVTRCLGCMSGHASVSETRGAVERRPGGSVVRTRQTTGIEPPPQCGEATFWRTARGSGSRPRS